MPFNFMAVLVAALSTFIVGFIWYNPKVFGTIWMREIGMTEEKAKTGNLLKIFGLTFIYSLMLSLWMPQLTIHQTGVLEAAGGNSNDAAFLAFMEVHGNAFRTFKHGALHGFLAGVFIALPVVAIGSLFEQKSWRYILISAGYWTVSMTIMGAILCGWN